MVTDDGSLIGERMFYRLGEGGQPVPMLDKAEWAQWMKENQASLKFLVKTGPVSVGVKFIGEEQGLSPSGSPLLWQMALFMRSKCLTTVHKSSIEEVQQLLQTSLKDAAKNAPTLKLRIQSWWLAKVLDRRIRRAAKKLKNG